MTEYPAWLDEQDTHLHELNDECDACSICGRPMDDDEMERIAHDSNWGGWL